MELVVGPDTYDDSHSVGSDNESVTGEQAAEQRYWPEEDYVPVANEEKAKFDFRSDMVFLTYIQCSIGDHEEFHRRLEERFAEVGSVLHGRNKKIVKFRVFGCKELHEDGNPHYHVLVVWDDRVRYRDARSAFTLSTEIEGSSVPVHQSLDIRVRDYAKQDVASFLSNVQAYIAKDANPYVFGARIECSSVKRVDRVCHDVIAEPDFEVARDMLIKNFPRDWIWKHSQAVAFLESKKRKRVVDRVEYPASSWDVPAEIDKWRRANFTDDGSLRVLEHGCRYTALVVIGEPCTGKSLWATSWGDPDHMRELYNVDVFTENSTHLVVDDCDIHDFKAWRGVMGCQRSFDATGKYRQITTVKFNKPTVWLCNPGKNPMKDRGFAKWVKNNKYVMVVYIGKRKLFKTVVEQGVQKRQKTGCESR